MPECPVCKKEAAMLHGERYHCGSVRLLIKVNDHYLGFKNLPEKLPEKGCPICGKPMKPIGKFRWFVSDKEDGLPRMQCDQQDHYCYVTEIWYRSKNR